MTTITTVPLDRPEAHPMLLVDCPLCDTPAPFDAARDSLDCPICNIRLDLVPERELPELAVAA